MANLNENKEQSRLNNLVPEIKDAAERKRNAILALIGLIIGGDIIFLAAVPSLFAKVALVICWTLLLIVIPLKLWPYLSDPTTRDDRDKLQLKALDSHVGGSAEWETEEEREEVWNRHKNYWTATDTIIGKSNDEVRESDGSKSRYDLLYTLKQRYGINLNMLIIGPPGCGKSRCFVIPFIMNAIRRGESLIVTDIKGELYRITSLMCRAHDYIVKVIDFRPEFMTHSDSCDFLAPLKNAVAKIIKAQSIANTIIINSTDKVEFFDKGEGNLEAAELVRLIFDNTYQEKTLAEQFELLVTRTPDEIADFYISNSTGENRHLYMQGLIFANSKDSVRQDIWAGLGIKLATLSDPIIGKVTGYPDIDFRAPGKQKCIYYVACSDQDSSMQFYSALFFTLLYQELVAEADKSDSGRNPVTVNFLLDEFANLGVIPDFHKKLATVRGRGINTQIIVQGLEQLIIMYPDDLWQSIINCCSLTICLGTNNKITAEYMRDIIGYTTRKDIGIRYTTKFRSFLSRFAKPGSDYNMSESNVSRYLCMLDEVRRLKNNQILVVPQTANPVILEKIDYEYHPMFKEVREVPLLKHTPEWVKAVIEETKKTKDANLPVKYSLDLEEIQNAVDEEAMAEELKEHLCTEADFKQPLTTKQRNKWKIPFLSEDDPDREGAKYQDFLGNAAMVNRELATEMEMSKQSGPSFVGKRR